MDDRSSRMTTYSFAQALPKTDRAIYSGRTVMLIDERTVSQAEWTGLLFEAVSSVRAVEAGAGRASRRAARSPG